LPEERREVFDLAEAVADATGRRNQRESDFLARVAARLGLAPAPLAPPAPTPREQEVDTPRSPVPAAENPRAVLEIDPGLPLTADLVRRQYRLLTERYAPEKFEAVGAEFVAVARAKRDAVHSAALALLGPMGEPLETEAPAPPAELRHNPDLDSIFGA
jgi:hypothetical protein